MKGMSASRRSEDDVGFTCVHSRVNVMWRSKTWIREDRTGDSEDGLMKLRCLAKPRFTALGTHSLSDRTM